MHDSEVLTGNPCVCNKFLRLYSVALTSACSQLVHHLCRPMAMESEHAEFSSHSIGRPVAGNTSLLVPDWRVRKNSISAFVRFVSAYRKLRIRLQGSGRVS
jgi:hypothetical protein